MLDPRRRAIRRASFRKPRRAVYHRADKEALTIGAVSRQGSEMTQRIVERTHRAFRGTEPFAGRRDGIMWRVE